MLELKEEIFKNDEEIYLFLTKQINHLFIKEDNFLSSLSNLTSILKQYFEKISWVGFYLFDGNELYLGPFQGKFACTKIAIGKGVCGTSAFKRETIIVPDVDKFESHIACDSASKSEIVVPILKNGELYGVLDLDSTSYNSFNEIDKKYLEQIVNQFSNIIF